MSLLEVRNLRTSFFTDAGEVKAVNDTSFDVEPGQVLSIVGESGSGKSVTAYSIMQILSHPGCIVSGSIKLRGRELVGCDEKTISSIRGNVISMIFQDPMTSLNPVFTIGNQLEEAILLHTGRTKEEAAARAVEMLELVGINEPEKRVKQYPHELSGGMRQRVMIAMALCCNPGLLIADEPTTALDVTIQAQIMALLRNLQKESGMSMILITHDIGLVASMADRVIVMYAGQMIEEAPVKELFAAPAHPYTKALLQTVPGIYDEKDRELVAIPGMVPENYDSIPGCRFADRCAFRTKDCDQPQSYRQIGEGHFVRGMLAKEGET